MRHKLDFRWHGVMQEFSSLEVGIAATRLPHRITRMGLPNDAQVADARPR